MLLSIFSLALFFQEIPDRVIPHITKENGGFTTEIHLQNHSNSEKSVYLQPFNEEGKALTPLELVLKPQERMQFQAFEKLDPNSSHVFISGTDRISLSCSIKSSSRAETQSSFGEQNSFGKRYDILPIVQETGLWEGFAIVNPNDWAIEVSIQRLDYALTETIPSKGKRVLLADKFSNDSKSSEPYRLSSTDVFSAVALGGSQDFKYIWLSEALPDPSFSLAKQTDQSLVTLQDNPYEILEAAITEEVLTLKIRLPSYCRNESILWSGDSFMESNPVQINISMVNSILPNANCMRVFSEKEEKFDLSSIYQLYETAYGQSGELIINLLDNQGEIHQSFQIEPFK